MRERGIELFNIVRVATFLATRYITRTTWWQTALVVFVMTLTFLNLVVVNGVLVGLIDGALLGYKQSYAGDLLISKLPEKEYIERSSAIESALQRDTAVTAWSKRVVVPGTIEAHYQERIAHPNRLPDSVGVSIASIDLVREDMVTSLSGDIIEGSFLAPGDADAVVLGANLLERHFPSGIGRQTLADIYPGDKVRITIDDSAREFFVKGIVQTKADATDLRVFMLENSLRNLAGEFGTPRVDEFALRTTSAAAVSGVQQRLLARGFDDMALIRTTEEVIGEFLGEIKDTFSVLGNIIGSISVVVASITIFIIIFITAITRQKYIGILKAIGISGITIELSYVLLSLFYALVGIGIGLVLLYSFLVPYIAANPIDFPFSDGILSVTPAGTALRSTIILLTTLVAGYIPARIIVKKNTLDAILGR